MADNHDGPEPRPADDLAALRELRSDVAAMSDHAFAHGYARATSKTRARSKARAPRRIRRRRPRRLALAATLAVLALVTVGVVGVSGPRPASIAGAQVLARAVAFARALPALTPAADEFIYRVVKRQNGFTALTVETWESVDGHTPGLMRTTVGTAVTNEVMPADAGPGLADQSYAQLEKLTEDPTALLAQLRSDPGTLSDIRDNGMKPTVAVWGQIRMLAERIPPQRLSVLFEAAEQVSGLSVERGVPDALGHRSVALGMVDPRLGNVQPLFDPVNGRFRGERISTIDSSDIEFTSSVTSLTAVATVGATS